MAITALAGMAFPMEHTKQFRDYVLSPEASKRRPNVQKAVDWFEFCQREFSREKRIAFGRDELACYSCSQAVYSAADGGFLPGLGTANGYSIS